MIRQTINVQNIQVEEPFSTLFPVNNDTVEAIKNDMDKSGYDEAFPVIIWQDKNIIVDGHTRLTAAKMMELEEIPALLRDFKNQDEAILYAFHLQRNRRNLNDEDILRCLQILDEIDPSLIKENEDSNLTQKEITEQRAQELGTSKNKIDQARTLMKHGSEEIIDAVGSGEKSIGKAYSEVQDNRRESGELNGPATTGLASGKKYKKALASLTKQVVQIKEDGWNEVPRETILKDLEQMIQLIEEGF